MASKRLVGLDYGGLLTDLRQRYSQICLLSHCSGGDLIYPLQFFWRFCTFAPSGIRLPDRAKVCAPSDRSG